MRVSNKNRVGILLVAVVVLGSLLVASLPPKNTEAAQITTRKLTLQAGATDGGSKPSGVVKHAFDFTIPTNGDVGSIKFLYCTAAAGTCTTPTGLSTTSATLDSQSGATGFSMVNTTQGSPYLTRTASNVPSNTTVSYLFGTVTNPDGTDCSGTQNNCTFYVRISTYTSTDTSGTAVDEGVVAAAVAQQIVLTGIMPESLIFCVGGTITVTDSIPDCATTTSGAISFNQLFSPAATAYATSQMAASTNAINGYSVTVNGATLTSGANTIPAMSSSDTSKIGHGQFGMNLVDNATPNVGGDIDPASNGTDKKGRAIPASGYDVADSYKFASGDAIADSASGGAGGTDAQRYISSYIVNVAGHQTAGTYTTTLTYICTPTF